MNPQGTQPNTQPMGQTGAQTPQQMNPFQNMMNTVKQNPNSDYAQAVFDKIRSGDFNDLAKQYGYDLTPFNTKPTTTPQTPSQEPGFASRLGSDFMRRGQEVVSAIQKPSELTQEGGSPIKIAQAYGEAGLRTAGAVAGAAADIVGEAAKSAWNTFVPDSIKNVVSGAVQQGGNDFLQAKNILGQTNQQTIQGIANFAAKHPEATKDLGSVVDIASLFGLKAAPGAQMTGEEAVAGAKGIVSKGTQIAEDIAGKAKGIITKSPESVAAKNLEMAVKDATPAYSKRLIGEPAIKTETGMIPRVQEGGAIKGRIVTPTTMEKSAGAELLKVPNYPTNGTALQKFQAIQPEIAARAEALAKSLKDEGVLRPPQQIVKVVKDAISNVSKESLLLQKSDPVISNYLRVLNNAVKVNDGTLAGELDVRKAMDAAYKNARGKLAFGSEKISALDDIHTAARDALNQDMIAHARNTDVKASLKSQWDLIRASDVLRDKAEAEAKTSIGRFTQKYPLTSKAAKAAGRAAGLGAGIDIMGGL